MDELDLLRSFRESPAGPDRAARQRAARNLRAAIEPPRRRRPRNAALAVGGAAAVAAIGVALVGPFGGDSLTTADAVAAERLRDVAAVAEGRPDPRAIGPDEVWYQRSIEAYLLTAPTYAGIQPQVREQWLGRDGNGRVRTRPSGKPRFPAPSDRAAWQAAGSPSLAETMDTPLQSEDAAGNTMIRFPLGQESVDFQVLAKLPTETAALHARLKQVAALGGGEGPDDELFTIVGDLLRGAPIPSDLRGGLFRVAARIPGIRFAGATKDAAGRRGAGISRDGRDERRTLIFDPATGELLGERQVALRNSRIGVPEGTVVGDVAYIESGVVGSVDERP